MSVITEILEAQRRFMLELMAKGGVVGVGIGYKDTGTEVTDELVLVALVEQKKPLAALRSEDMIPSEVQGIRTDVKEIGIMTAQVNSSPRDSWRPVIPAGVTIGHYLVTAGTYGAMVYDKTTGDAFILSNNHVLANSNDALLNDPILQAAATDGGQNPADVVAHLARFGKLLYVGDPQLSSNPIIGLPETPPPSTGGNEPPRPPASPPATNNGCATLLVEIANALAGANKAPSSAAQAVGFAQAVDTAAASTIEAQAAVPENAFDAALAKPMNPAMFSPEIQNIGRILGTTTVSIGMKVRKMGRTTGYTEGTVTVVNTTIDVGYSTQAGRKTARFSGQVMTSGMSQGGDSGSLIVAKDSPHAVGLLFAGSGTATVFTPIDLVLARLQVQMTPKV